MYRARDAVDKPRVPRYVCLRQIGRSKTVRKKALLVATLALAIAGLHGESSAEVDLKKIEKAFRETPLKLPEPSVKDQVWISEIKGGPLYGLLTIWATFKNGSRYDVKDLKLHCAYFGASGTQIGSVTKTIYEAVPFSSEKKISEFPVGFIDPQIKSFSCEIVNLVIGARHYIPVLDDPPARHNR